MKLGVCLLMFLMLLGCTSKQPSSSNIEVPQKEIVELESGDTIDIQVWEEGMELESGDAEAPSFSEKLSDMFIEDVRLRIYDVQGVMVRQLALGYQPARVYENKSRAAYWDGRNTIGEPVASGVYFYTLTAGNFTATQKMLIRK